jgi:transcriptional regulator with XRE-family HTH domain
MDPIIEQLKNLRISLDMTQQAVAQLMGAKQSMVSEWESGNKQPRLASLHRWAEALGYDLTLTPREDG